MAFIGHLSVHRTATDRAEAIMVVHYRQLDPDFDHQSAEGSLRTFAFGRGKCGVFFYKRQQCSVAATECIGMTATECNGMTALCDTLPSECCKEPVVCIGHFVAPMLGYQPYR